MNNRRKPESVFKSAARFIAAALLVCSITLFVMPSRTVKAEVGQPEIPVPALADIHCASYCVYDKTTGFIVLRQALSCFHDEDNDLSFKS